MTKDDIIRMAHQTLPVILHEGEDDRLIEQLTEFAALVAAAEREKVAQWMMQRGYATGHGDTLEDLLKELEWQIAERCRELESIAIEIEREECAKVCALWQNFDLATAIRARGKK